MWDTLLKFGVTGPLALLERIGTFLAIGSTGNVITGGILKCLDIWADFFLQRTLWLSLQQVFSKTLMKSDSHLL